MSIMFRAMPRHKPMSRFSIYGECIAARAL
jgi:hypothetical protein